MGDREELGDLVGRLVPHLSSGSCESEKRYRTIFERNLNPIAIVGMDGRYVEANEAFFEFVEKTREELLVSCLINCVSVFGNSMHTEIENMMDSQN